MHTPDTAFHVLYQQKAEKQLEYLQKLEDMNQNRRDTQSDILKEIEQNIDFSKNVLIAVGEFHE
jgi:single-stranded DNA-specific DHH superfamily exonuclease